jgi:hypothetical protein
MHRRIHVPLIILALLIAAEVTAGEYAEVEKSRPEPQPTGDQAVVYVVRPALAGKAVKMWAFVDTTPIGVNKGRQCTYALVPAGRHIFWARAENISAMEMDIEPGKIYYLKQDLRMGVMKARVALEVLAPEEGEKALAKCSYTTLTPEGQKRAAEIAQADYSRAMKALSGGETAEAEQE